MKTNKTLFFKSLSLSLALTIPAFLFILAPTSTVRAIDCTDPMYANDAECAGITPDSPAPAVDCSDPAFSNNTECSGVSDSAPATSNTPTNAAGQSAATPGTTPGNGVTVTSNSRAAARLDYSGLVKCDGVVDKADPAEKSRQNVCNFAALVNQVKAIINWMFVISISVAVALFAYAGVLYMTGTSGNKSKARSIFETVGIGFLLMLSAWFIVTTIMNWLAKSGQGYSSLIGGN